MIDTAKNLFLARRTNSVVVAVAVLVFVIMSSASSMTNRPQIDEGMFASASYNLAFNGFFGTTVLEMEHSPLTRINERTYWVMPLFLLNAAASFKLFGFSIESMRLVSILAGVLFIFSGYFVAKKLTGSAYIATLAFVLLSLDYMVLDTSSQARPDMLCAALGLASIAAYLNLRERNLSAAIIVSQTLVVLAGLTHPNGLLAFFAVTFLSIYYDRKQLNLKVIGLAAAPYLIFGTAFGVWILQDFQAFKDQFIDNALMGGRLSGVNSPLTNIVREFTERYPHAYGLQMNSSGHTGPIALKGLILLGYIIGVLGVLFTGELRRDRNYRVLLMLTAIYFLWLAFIDGQKQTYYIIQIIPFYLIMLAIWLHWLWNRVTFTRPIIALGVCALLLLGVGGMSLRVKQNTYGRLYQPAIEYLKQNAGTDKTIMGGAELGFGLNFAPNHIADGRFGYYTRKEPDFIVYDSAVEISWQASKTFFPDFYTYLPNLLKEKYTVVYENPGFTIYQKK